MRSLRGSERAERYCESVLSGAVPACQETRQAVTRQADDLLLSEYSYEPDAADRVIDFIELLPHVTGRGFVGRPLLLEDWQCFVVATVFGWVDSEGMRRFRTAYVEVPRKNGKSVLSAALGLYLLTADGEPGAEVYSAATGREQARIVFRTAQQMVRGLPELQGAYGLKVLGGVGTVGVIHAEGGAVFRPLAKDMQGNLDGLNVHAAIVDELHAHKTRDMWDVLETATGARRQPLIWAITTAGVNRGGICYEQRAYLQRVLRRDAADDRYFGCIWSLDTGDRWDDPATWRKANPNWAVSVNPADIEAKAAKAREVASAQNNFLTKHLDVWVNAATAWLSMVQLEACVEPLDWADIGRQPVWIGIDLASRLDFAAVVYTWLREADGKLCSKARYYLSEESVKTSPNAQYSGWVREGHITCNPGGKTDFDYIERQLLADHRRYRIEGVAYDPFQAHHLVNHLSDAGLPMQEYGQTTGNMSWAMKEWEAAVRNGEYRYDGNPVTTWMAANVEAARDDRDNVRPVKYHHESKIDGALAQIMALALALSNDPSAEVY